MNRIFKVIYNRAKHCYIVASEMAKSYSTGGGSRSIRRAAAALCVAAAVYATAGSALAANSGGTSSGDDYIGVSPYHVTIDSDVSGSVYGHLGDNENIEEASVTMTGGTVNINVFGGYSESGSVASNSVNISGGKSFALYGGYSSSGDANENQVTMTGGVISYDFNGNVKNSGNLYGGYAEFEESNSNIVNISSGSIHMDVYGGWSYDAATSNIVNIIGGNVTGSLFGGYSYTDKAASNSVNISGGIIKYDVYGGHSNLAAVSNSVNISSGTICYVHGGFSSYDKAASNTVNISGGKIDYDVYGGISNISEAANNSVSISNGTINDSVYGGYSEEGSVTNNFVNISGDSTQITKGVYGGYVKSGSGSAKDNKVTISGGTFTSGCNIYGGFVNNSNNSIIKDNCVTLSEAVTGLDNSEIYGYYFYSGSGTPSDNEFHIGRAVDYDDEGNIKRDTDGNIKYKADESTIWQGKTSDDNVNNKIRKVANFESIVLHEIAWDHSLPALAAESFTYNENTALGGNVTLDISNIAFNTELPSGVITLLQSDTDDNFNGLKLKYSDSNAADISSSWQVVKSATNQTIQRNGISLTYDTEHSVSLAENNTKVNYFADNTFKEAELGAMNWSDGGYLYASTDGINASGLIVNISNNFAVEGAKDKNEGDSLVLLDLTNITNSTINEAVDSTKTIIYDKNPTSAASLTLSLSQTDEIKTNTEKNKLIYTIGKKNVTKATFDSELAWNISQPYYDASNSGYTFGSNSSIDTKNLTLAFSDDQKDSLKTNDCMTLISASGITDSNSVIQPDNNTFQLSRTGDMGTKFDGTATAVVFAETSAVKYKINKIETDKITLGSRSWSANAESLPDTWTAKADTVIDADDFAFTDKAETALASGDTKTLVEGSGIVAGSNIADKTLGIEYTDNSIILGATAFGQIETITDAVQFKVNSIALDSIDISGWKNTNEASSVPEGWAANANGVEITSTGFSPTLTSGSKTIITASVDMFKDENIDESIRYAEGSFNNALLENGVSHSGFQSGGLKASEDGKILTYYAMEKIIDKIDITGWDGEKAVSDPISWIINDGVSLETDGMINLPESDEEKQIFILKSDINGSFAKLAINGENAYSQKQFVDSDEAESVVLTGIQEKGVTLDSNKANILYKFGSKEVTSFKLNSITWEDGKEFLNRDKYNYSKLTTIDTNDFKVVFEKPETISVNKSMTLLKANETLADMASIDNTLSYNYTPVSGVTIDAIIRSSLEVKSGKVTLTTLSNKADKLTFGNIEWLDKGALIDHKTLLNNVSFDGTTVDTTKIAFTNKQKLDEDMQMTLVSNFDGKPGTIIGDKYKVGTAFEGDGSAYMDGSDLKFSIKTSSKLSDETHTTVMSMEAGFAMLAAGNEHVGNAIEGLGLAANSGSDGVSTFASVGGSSSSYKTGSHVDTNSWNCTLAVGKNLEKKDGTMEYGLFAEYGRGNYTLHMNGIEDAGSGNSHYTGGGLLLKWTNKHDVYTEASFRMGNMKDKSSNILHDGAGNAYGYDTSAKYRGGHFGIGKVCREEGGTKLEIYGKYFYNQREGINFAAGADQYSLDDVRSRVLRAGFRYSTTERKWNRYGGVAFDHEFGGKSNGTVNGNAIRSASVKGGTIRGEFGYCREATKTNPWKTDISLYGFTGKRNGFGGSVAVEYHF